MMKKTLLLTFLLLGGIGLSAQSVVASGGQSGTSNQLHASATIGEAIIGAQSAGTQSANQGFQQPLQKDLTAVFETSSNLKVNIAVGPVPTPAMVQIKLDQPAEGTFLLLDQRGRTVQKLALVKNQLKYTLDLTSLHVATYYLTVLSTDGKNLTTLPIIKI